MINLLKHLSKPEKENLFHALNYMKMAEIKEFCKKHSIPLAGKKGAILERIRHYLTTGQIKLQSTIPPVSKAKAGKQYQLAINTNFARRI